VARLRSVPVAFAAALGMGVVQSMLVDLAPSGSLLATAFQPAIPLIVLILFLILGPTIEQRSTTTSSVAGDRPPTAHRVPVPARLVRVGLVAAVAIVVPLLLSAYWMAAVAAGLTMAIIFLSFTVLGNGGITSLGQAAYAGLGGFFAAFLITSHGIPGLPAVILGGLLATGLGLLVALVSTRLGVLSLAVMTVAVAGFFDEFVVRIGWLVPGAGGSQFTRPVIGGLNFTSDRAYGYLMMVVFAVLALLLARVLRGPTGLVLRAVRSDAMLSQAIGLSPKVVRLLVFAAASFVAGVGGALLGTYQLQLGPADVATLVGFVWLAVVVTVGWRRPFEALVAGLVFTLMPAAFTVWLPDSWSQVPTVLFGLGAVGLAQAPDGIGSLYGSYYRSLRAKLGGPKERGPVVDAVPLATKVP